MNTLSLVLIFAAGSLSILPGISSWAPETACPSTCSCGLEYHRGLETQLRTVDCREKGLSAVPDNLPPDAQAVLLGGNRIPSVPSDQFWPRGLLVLDLSANGIRSLGKRSPFGKLNALQTLDLSRNKLSHIDGHQFEDLFNLRTLDLSWNSISGMDAVVFSSLHKLETLSLQHNRLTFISKDMWSSLHNLYELNLSHNYLSVIQQSSLHRLFSLLMLDLSHNRILQVHPLAFADLIRLEYLQLDGNQLYAVPRDSLKVFTRTLKSISLSRNPIYRIRSGDFIDMLELREISLSHMSRLKIIEANAFGMMPQILVFQVHDNPQLTFVSPSALPKSGAPKLTHLLIHNNNLPTVNEDFVNNLPVLEEISFYGNPVACDCNNAWLRELIWGRGHSWDSEKPQITFRESERLTCASPELFKFRMLSSLQSSDLNESCKPVMLSLDPSRITARVGDAVTIDCAAVGVPKPSVSWVVPHGAKDQFYYRNDGQTIVFTQATTKSSGRYLCLASNEHGVSTQTIDVEISSKPVEMNIKVTDSTSALVAWTKASDIVINLLVVKHLGASGYSKDYMVPLNSLMTSYFIQNLSEDSDYEVCVASQKFEQVDYLPVACEKFKSGLKQPSGNLSGSSQSRTIALVCAIFIFVCSLTVVALVIVAINLNRMRQMGSDSFPYMALGLCKGSTSRKQNFYANIQRTLIPSEV